MEHFEAIYAARAAEYHQMIAAEDADGQLLLAIERVVSPRGKRIVDLGTGTGRLPLLLGGQAALVVGLDLHRDMLRQNAEQRRRRGERWELVQGDMRKLPFPAASADIVTAGWAIGHMRRWFEADWRSQVRQVLHEMERVVVPGGALIIFETLSTGSLTPAPPTPGLGEYYDWLERDWGFRRDTIATDYRFASVDEAVVRTEFFFGPQLAARIRAEGWARLPEWTGVWSKHISA
ncbi:MAG TPA: class I SAM-dependent methyltransferase [Roseiflexaceae bacterium]|nr:class I SAM-dependent methyltransferase [Roseiflexaceae bacterium]